MTLLGASPGDGEVEAMLKKELGDDQIEIAQVGPAGEAGVRYAAIINMSNRANGRTGMGAVMGSKNLKAIAIKGTQKDDTCPPVPPPVPILAMSSSRATYSQYRPLWGLPIPRLGRFSTTSAWTRMTGSR